MAERHFGALTGWMDFVARGNSGYLRTRDLGHSYNDWLAPVSDDTPASCSPPPTGPTTPP